ncbi:hypothetical protein RHMOL_Rhmol10G0055500 [Rhododendron molle]|uniref:Uncharacterized protein n=1 Tax=Rhododendron molle TaxID=49168 RepID=A0ACC0LYZ8_RHOML|nr:hypothetical protein RHMOL_Rhmol10G0055500 [Rhododendron molle]
MENDEKMELPPGFRFHPTDEELITHYLSKKVLDSCFYARAIGEVDLNKVEPWDLPWKAKMGEREWYFFCVKDRKYPTGLRTNRATEAGYWKATGKDKEIYRGKPLVGMKKTLNEWVISRVFQKCSGGKKTHISGLVKMEDYGEELNSSPNLPPLMDYSAHVTCFSDQSEDKKPETNVIETFKSPLLPSSFSSKDSNFSPVSFPFAKVSVQETLFSTQFEPNIGNSHYPGSAALMQDNSMLRFFLENNGIDLKRCLKAAFSPETDFSSAVSNQDDPITSEDGPVDLGCLWNY